MCFVSGNKVAWVCPLSWSVYLSWEPPTQSSALIFKLSFWGSREWGLSDFCQERKGIPPHPQSSFCIIKRQEARATMRQSLQRWGNCAPTVPGQTTSSTSWRLQQGPLERGQEGKWGIPVEAKEQWGPRGWSKSSSWTPTVRRVQRHPLYFLPTYCLCISILFVSLHTIFIK